MIKPVLRLLYISLMCASPVFAAGHVEIWKPDADQVSFFKNGGDVYIRSGVAVETPDAVCAFSTDEQVTLPSLVAGTDYQIVIDDTCDLDARTYDAAITTGEHRVGGFHYLPGGYPDDHDLGGNSTPAILEWSFWDVAFRPICDPRGMTKIGNSPVWIDIYFLGDSSNADGVSRNDDPILTGTNPPERADDYGGYGASEYPTLNWWSANEFVAQRGKRLPTYGEMTRAAFGAREGLGRGNHPVRTGLNTYNASTVAWDFYFTSKFGLIQAVGSVWVWTSDLSDWEGTAATGPYGWDAYDVTEGRGKIILQNSDDLTALLFGGKSNYQDINGTRTTETIEKLWDNSVNIAIRGACDHYARL